MLRGKRSKLLPWTKLFNTQQNSTIREQGDFIIKHGKYRYSR
uniref:Uncharacterized protein n=1 Tax=Arundo donax TaxID=35708 RepID=A0A0A9HF80_ARUDO